MIEVQPVTITYWFGESYARVTTEQTVTKDDRGNVIGAEHSASYALSFVGLSDAAQADFTALYAAGQASGEPLQAFLDAHALTLLLPIG